MPDSVVVGSKETPGEMATHQEEAAEAQPAVAKRKKKKIPVISQLYEFVKDFSRVDTNYVEPQHYNYTFMLQNTNTYEMYQLRTSNGREVVFKPRPAYKLGPYFGWRWIFLGYTLDLGVLSRRDGRQDFNVSLYSNQIGVDIFYRRSGNTFRISRFSFGSDSNLDASPVVGQNFGGFKSSVRGGNLYYIFNHKKFSYPAAYSQSTVQRRSAGSPIVGLGYTQHKLDVDWLAFNRLVEQSMGGAYSLPADVDTTLMSTDISYTDYSVSGGYAYNWVFARNWLLDISLQAGLSYKHTTADTQRSSSDELRSFDLKNFNLDGIMRTGIVWNNTRWFAGANAIFHAYNYRKHQFSTNNIFGNVNVYVGFNFGKR